MNKRYYNYGDEEEPIYDDPEFPRGTPVVAKGFGSGVAWRVDHVNPLDAEWVELIMVGDDRPQQFERSEIEKIDEDDFCEVCGQIGCTHDGRQRDE